MARNERSLKATAAGCQKLTEALKNSRYTKSLIGDFIEHRKRGAEESQGVSRATIHKAFKGEPVDRPIFIGLCKLLGLNWQEVADLATSKPSSLEPELIDSPLISFLDNLRSAASSKYSQIPEQEVACEMIRILIFRLVSQQCEDYLVDEFFSNWNQEIFFKSKDILIFEIKLKLLKNKRIHKTFLLSTLQKIGYDRMSLLVDIFLYIACRNHSFLSNSRDCETAEKYFDQDSLNHQKFTLLTCCMAINQSKAFEEHYLCDAQNLLENLEVGNFSTLWLTKIVILAGHLEKIEIMESALNALNRSKRDEDGRGEMEQIIDSCCIKINQYFVSSITGRDPSSEKILRCPGYAHVIAHDSRMICKNELILKSLEKMSLKWKNPLKAQDIKTRLNRFAESCLEKAGTPFFDWMS